MNTSAKILVVDNDTVLLKAAQRALESAGYETLGTQSGGEALQLVQAYKPDLILLDMILPDMDSFDVCRRIKSEPDMAGIDVILLSRVHTDSDNQAEGLDFGADGYIVRPVPDRELLARVRAMLRIKATEQALHLSEQRFHAICERLPLGYQSLDTDGYLVDVNQAWLDFLGYMQEEVIGKWFGDFLVPEQRELFKERFSRFKQAGETHNVEFEMLHKNGNRIIVSFEGRIGYDEHMQFKQTHCILTDITARKRAEEALRESEEQFKYLFDHSVTGESITLPSGELNVNQALCEMLGYSQEELRNRKWQELTHPEDVELTQNAINPLLSGEKETVRFTKKYIHRNGSIVWTDVGTTLRRDKEGKPLYFMTSVNDITERKRAEDALRESEAQFRIIFENASDAIHVDNSNDEIIQVNPRMCEMMGYSREELLKMNVADLQAPEVRGKRGEIIHNELACYGKAVFEGLNLHHSGRLIPVEISVSRFGSVQGNMFVSIVRDITERKQAERDLRMSEERFRGLYENATIGMYRTTPDGRILMANPALVSKLGYQTFDELAQRDLTKAGYEPSYPRQDFQKLIERDGKVSGIESAWKRKDGTTLLMLESARLVRDENNQPLYYEGTVEDITERKRAEEALRDYNTRLEAEVNERTGELRAAQEQLIRQEKLAVLGQLAGGVGHELRNPLGVINNAVYFLKLIQPEADEKVKEYLGMIEKETHTAEKIITDLLDFARIKSVDKEPVSVSELIQPVLARFPAPESVTVSLNFPASLPNIYVDPRQMEQVLGNLVVNAYQAMPQEGVLTLSAKKKRKEIAVAVADTGVGIPLENISKLFEPLFTTKPKGIGLGLAVSQKLIEANGGRIEVTSEPGKGSVFTVYLPVS